MSSGYIGAAQRARVARRALFRCEYCLTPAKFSTSTYEIDHVRPRAKAGEALDTNLAFSCGGCNGRKGDRMDGKDPTSGRRVRLFNPRRQRWERHFTWTDDRLRVIGITAVGRLTVQALALNREELTHLRRILLLDGSHPSEPGTGNRQPSR